MVKIDVSEVFITWDDVGRKYAGSVIIFANCSREIKVGSCVLISEIKVECRIAFFFFLWIDNLSA